MVVSCRSHVLCSVAACSGNIYILYILFSNLRVRLRPPVQKRAGVFPPRAGLFRERRAAAMLYRVLFTVLALLAATQAQEDPCLGEDYAEAHCARLPACTAWTLASA